MASFWCWLDEQAAQGKEWDEYEIGEWVSKFRAEQPGFSEESFATIAGEGPHGAIIHYRASVESARKVGQNSLLLCDSGGQYDCGTTDVTRTHHLGTPTNTRKRVHPRLTGATSDSPRRFSPRTPAVRPRCLRAWHLWEAGLDYRHGTGHGGRRRAQRARGPAEHLSEVREHDGPRARDDPLERTGLLRGRRIRDQDREPARGEGEEARTSAHPGDKKHLPLDYLTHIPIQKKLIDFSLMSGS